MYLTNYLTVSIALADDFDNNKVSNIYTLQSIHVYI